MPIESEIIATGAELLAGTIVDTNAAVLAKAVVTLGATVRRQTVVGDRLDDIAEAVATAIDRADLVWITGGIGPTQDDLTRQAVAVATGRPLVRDAGSVRRLTALFARRGWTLSRTQLRQADRPRRATVLPNSAGTADGFLMSLRNRHGRKVWIGVLPGVPKEMERMLIRTALPILRRVFPAGPAVERKILRLYGAGEASAEEKIVDLMNDATGARVGIRATPEALEVSIEAAAASRPAAQALRRRVEARLRRRLGDLVFGTGPQQLEEVVIAQLRRQGRTLALAESCTGGLLAQLLTGVPGASEVLLEGIVSYSNEAKSRRLGVPPAQIRREGAVSAAVAARMAQGVRSGVRADIGIGITGIAGPTGGSTAKPVGLVYIAFAGPFGESVEEYHFHGDRNTVRQRAARTALNRLRLLLDAAGR